MACPYFVPDERCDAELWQHRSRLPLGNGFRGRCVAPGHAGHRPDDEELRACNMGYPVHCKYAPEEREVDAVRFSVAKSDGSRILLRWACEREHRPVCNGELICVWIEGGVTAESAPAPAWIEPLALCYARAYFLRKQG